MFHQTKENTVLIGSNQYLKEVLIAINTNLIVFKKLPGSGATTGELENHHRNSIIIEPNVPVIIGKCKKFNKGKVTNVLGVYEGKTEEHILDYLQSIVQPKKIMVTPESFRRVKEVILEMEDYNLYNDFFLLFDECERTIQDISYRADIILPMQDFFHFKQKAFISATPIIPSDPRFEGSGFKALYIEPDYDYKENVQLLSTNNVFLTLKST